MSNTAFTLEYLASKYGCKIEEGEPSTVVTNVATLSNASKDSLTFFANIKLPKSQVILISVNNSKQEHILPL